MNLPRRLDHALDRRLTPVHRALFSRGNVVKTTTLPPLRDASFNIIVNRWTSLVWVYFNRIAKVGGRK